MKHEYLTHLIPFDPGPAGKTTLLLNGLAREGWRLVALHPAERQTITAYGPAAEPAVLVVLEREVTTA